MHMHGARLKFEKIFSSKQVRNYIIMVLLEYVDVFASDPKDFGYIYTNKTIPRILTPGVYILSIQGKKPVSYFKVLRKSSLCHAKSPFASHIISHIEMASL